MRDGRLCGYILAIYDDEPFAHIVTAEKAFSDIRSLLQRIGQKSQILRVATRADFEELHKAAVV